MPDNSFVSFPRFLFATYPNRYPRGPVNVLIGGVKSDWSDLREDVSRRPEACHRQWHVSIAASAHAS